jgi:D-alanine-D-alanine ligase-like ATP-grasp enzyme
MHCVICVGEGAGTKEELNGLRRSSVAVKRALIELGISAEIHIVRDTANIAKCDFVFNLCDNDENYFDSFINFTSFLERINMRYTGNKSRCFKVCYDKLKWSESSLLKKYFPLRSDSLFEMSLPCIVKHRYNHGSLCPIYVINCETDLINLTNDRANYFYEEFINGKEISVSCLPNHEPLCGVRSVEHEKILDFQTKWHGAVGIEKYTLSIEQNNYITKMVKDIRCALHVDSYMRLDLRISSNGELHLIDINPNCSMDQEGAFSSILSLHDISYKNIVEFIVSS